jgi:hypothetical protein
MTINTICDGCENSIEITVETFGEYWNGVFYCSNCKEKYMTLITLCAGCRKQVTVKVDTTEKCRSNRYYCAECENVPTHRSLALYGDTINSCIDLNILDGDGTQNCTSTFTSGGGKYISTEERKYNKLKELVIEINNETIN